MSAKKKEINAEYREIARRAYSNALDLHDEARLLLKEEKSPRAFTLAVASCEELVKSFLADIVWKEGLDPQTLYAERDDGRKRFILTDHTSKHGLFALFLFLAEVRRGGPAALEAVSEELMLTFKLDFGSVKGGASIEKMMRELERMRQDSVYVGVKLVNGRIKNPKQEITLDACEDLLKRIEEFIPRLEANLPVGRDQYQGWARKLRSTRIWKSR